jgi:hypothetical protein
MPRPFSAFRRSHGTLCLRVQAMTRGAAGAARVRRHARSILRRCRARRPARTRCATRVPHPGLFRRAANTASGIANSWTRMPLIGEQLDLRRSARRSSSRARCFARRYYAEAVDAFAPMTGSRIGIELRATLVRLIEASRHASRLHPRQQPAGECAAHHRGRGAVDASMQEKGHPTEAALPIPNVSHRAHTGSHLGRSSEVKATAVGRTSQISKSLAPLRIRIESPGTRPGSWRGSHQRSNIRAVGIHQVG